MGYRWVIPDLYMVKTSMKYQVTIRGYRVSIGYNPQGFGYGIETNFLTSEVLKLRKF